MAYVSNPAYPILVLYPLWSVILSSPQHILVPLFLVQTLMGVKWEAKVPWLSYLMVQNTLFFIWLFTQKRSQASFELQLNTESHHDWWIYQCLISLIIHGDVEAYLTQLSPIPLVRLVYLSVALFTFGIYADGVRAGAKRLGRKKQLTDVQKELMLKHRLSPPNPLCIPPLFCFGLNASLKPLELDIEAISHTSHLPNHMNCRS